MDRRCRAALARSRGRARCVGRGSIAPAFSSDQGLRLGQRMGLVSIRGSASSRQASGRTARRRRHPAPSGGVIRTSILVGGESCGSSSHAPQQSLGSDPKKARSGIPVEPSRPEERPKKSAVSRTALKSTKGGGFGGNVGLASNVRPVSRISTAAASILLLRNREARCEVSGSMRTGAQELGADSNTLEMGSDPDSNDQRTTSTGMRAWLRTLRVSLPSNMDMMLRRP